jgi:hypothetical protein
MQRRAHQARAETTCTEETAGITTEVNMPQAKYITGPTPYASCGDFCRIFYEEIDSLYLLSLLLTADREKAELCFVCGLEDSVNGNPVFKEWARSWARRTIIQKAVRVINPRPREESAPSDSNSSAKTTPAGPAEIAAVLGLGPFERFVYVMSVLEGYSDQDCSVLLGCARRDVSTARIRALQRIEGRRNFTLIGR